MITNYLKVVRGTAPFLVRPRSTDASRCATRGPPRSGLGFRATRVSAPTPACPRTRFPPNWSHVRGVVNARVVRDTLLFEHDKRTSFFVLGCFAASQFVFWVYLGHFAFTCLKDDADMSDADWTARFLTGKGRLILMGATVFSLRSVNRLVLRRGGEQLTFSTYLPFGISHSFTVPLRDVSCKVNAADMPTLLPVKVKNRPFFFLLDKKGMVSNQQLFNFTVGAYRTL
uniref:Transmembrane protein 223 n=1 Tax=Eptatretus burgeri TaxID=7764 RepID=A0A8C4QE56_EPTBU